VTFPKAQSSHSLFPLPIKKDLELELRALSADVVLKTDSGYPKDVGVTINPGNPIEMCKKRVANWMSWRSSCVSFGM